MRLCQTLSALKQVLEPAEDVGPGPAGPARGAAAYAAGQRLSVAEAVAQVLAAPMAG